MKTSVPLFILLTVSACQDAPLRRHGSCIRETDKSAPCSYQTSLESEFTRLFVAEVTVGAAIGQTQLVLKDSDKNEDTDGDYFCTLEVKAGTKFNYQIEKNVLTLTNGINSLTFNKTEGTATPGIIGTWSSQELTRSSQIITELIIPDLEEIRFRKTCKVK